MNMQLYKIASSFRVLSRSNKTRGIYLREMCKRNYALYVQGQSPEPRIREYFYYVDHQGMLFLDDARMKNFTSCFKGLSQYGIIVKNKNGVYYKKFLAFFFKRLKLNDTERYREDFPYVSLCGLERNFVRCDDLPIVFTKIVRKENVETGNEEDWFGYSHAEESLMVPFEPRKIFMDYGSGRVYHPAPDKAGGIGLVASKIAIELSIFFGFTNGEDKGPTYFTWKNNKYQLDCEWFKEKEAKFLSKKK